MHYSFGGLNDKSGSDREQGSVMHFQTPILLAGILALTGCVVADMARLTTPMFPGYSSFRKWIQRGRQISVNEKKRSIVVVLIEAKSWMINTGV